MILMKMMMMMDGDYDDEAVVSSTRCSIHDDAMHTLLITK